MLGINIHLPEFGDFIPGTNIHAPELCYTAVEEQEKCGIKHWAINEEINTIVSQPTGAPVQVTESDVTPEAFVCSLN
jgi:hypothetical protein